MQKFLALFLVLGAASAQADIIKCQFTEPFLTTVYSTTQQTLTLIDDYTQYPKKITKVTAQVSFQIKGAGEFQLVNKAGVVLQTLKLSNQGSDGMSDVVYPYQVQWSNSGYNGMANENSQNVMFGGCSSNYLPTKQGQP